MGKRVFSVLPLQFGLLAVSWELTGQNQIRAREAIEDKYGTSKYTALFFSPDVLQPSEGRSNRPVDASLTAAVFKSGEVDSFRMYH